MNHFLPHSFFPLFFLLCLMTAKHFLFFFSFSPLFILVPSTHSFTHLLNWRFMAWATTQCLLGGLFPCCLKDHIEYGCLRNGVGYTFGLAKYGGE